MRRDWQYTEERNKLIPFAYKETVLLHGKPDQKKAARNPEWAGEWNRYFLGKMDELAKLKGLVG